MLNPEMHQM